MGECMQQKSIRNIRFFFQFEKVFMIVFLALQNPVFFIYIKKDTCVYVF